MQGRRIPNCSLPESSQALRRSQTRSQEKGENGNRFQLMIEVALFLCTRAARKALVTKQFVFLGVAISLVIYKLVQCVAG
jgi:hypothetical protein